MVKYILILKRRQEKEQRRQYMRAKAIQPTLTRVHEIGLILFFTGLMILASFIRIPLFFTPVPLTLHTAVVFLSVLVIRQKAFFSHALYVFLGIIGLPVFSQAGGGIGYLLGPTGGYIWGFLLVCIVLPHFISKDVSFKKIFVLFFLFNIICIYGLGVLWLIFAYRFTFSSAFYAGVFPFLLVDTIKIAAVSSLALRHR
jgi:biotin transport system substrate-specific component